MALMDMYKTKEKFAGMASVRHSYVTRLYITTITIRNDYEAHEFDTMTAKSKDTTKINTYWKYFNTTLGLSKDTLEAALDYRANVVHECWLNTSYDFDQDMLLSKNRKVITREVHLQTINNRRHCKIEIEHF